MNQYENGFFKEKESNYGFYPADGNQPVPAVKTKKRNASGKARGGRFWKRCVSLVVGAALFGGVAGGVFNYVSGERIRELRQENDGIVMQEEQIAVLPQQNDLASSTEYTPVSADQGFTIPTADVVSDGQTRGSSLDVSDIAGSVMPSIVSVTVSGVQQVANYFGYPEQREFEGCGSGIIIGENDTDLLIVTNNHVIENANTVSVSFIDDVTYDAEVKSANDENDLAVITVKLNALSDETKNSILIAKLGDSDAVKVGEQVVAIGNALGYGQSVTTGIVSAKNCTNTTNASPLIQTDAAINPGNSGGALINMQGEVIGINSSKYASTEVEGMGFAIPISSINDVLDDLVSQVEREKIDEKHRGYLGIGCGTVTDEMAYMYGIPAGVMITEILPGLAADTAGLRKNDVITKLNGRTVKTADALIEELAYYKKGETVTVTYQTLENDRYVEKEMEIKLGRKG